MKAIVEALMGRVSTLKHSALVLHHKTMYEGALERATFMKYYCNFPFLVDSCAIQVAADMMNEHQQELYLAVCSETENPATFSYAATQVKDKLLEDPQLNIQTHVDRTGSRRRQEGPDGQREHQVQPRAGHFRRCGSATPYAQDVQEVNLQGT